MTGKIDIGGGHQIAYYTVGDEDDTHVGLIDFHHKPDGSPCSGGSVLFDVPQNSHAPGHVRWQLISEDPLTLSPSLLCGLCGDHGWIRDGRWVAA